MSMKIKQAFSILVLVTKAATTKFFKKKFLKTVVPKDKARLRPQLSAATSEAAMAKEIEKFRSAKSELGI